MYSLKNEKRLSVPTLSSLNRENWSPCWSPLSSPRRVDSWLMWRPVVTAGPVHLLTWTSSTTSGNCSFFPNSKGHCAHSILSFFSYSPTFTLIVELCHAEFREGCPYLNSSECRHTTVLCPSLHLVLSIPFGDFPSTVAHSKYSPISSNNKENQEHVNQQHTD